MPKFPEMSSRLANMQGAVFEKYRDLMQSHGDKLIRLHIGDTYLPPEYQLPIEPSLVGEFPDLYRYCDTFGVEVFREELAQKVRMDNKLNVKEKNILVTCGATNALSSAVHTLLDQNDAIMLLTPCWPIMQGIVKSAGVEISEVPVYHDLYSNADLAITDCLEKYLHENTAAIYVNSPNNPSGKVLGKEQMREIAAFAKKNNLWLILDEAYEGLLFDDLQHHCLAEIDDIFERTVSVFTFSKIFMFAGLRLGYAVAHEEVIKNMNKIMVHQIYSPPSLTQMMMTAPLRNRHNWMEKVRTHYQLLRDLFLANLNINLHKPEATYFIFFEVSRYLKNMSYDDLIRGIFAQGVSVAPGADFGKGYTNFIRLCFTGETPERLAVGAEKLNKFFEKINAKDQL